MSGSSWSHVIARPLVRPMIGTAIRPNHLTTLRLVSGLAACVCLALGTRAGAWWGGGLWILSAFLDRADGELARLGNLTSRAGHLYDTYADILVNALLFVAIGVGLRHGWLGAAAIPLGLLAGLSLLLASIFAHLLERRSPAGFKTYSGAWGFDPEDALYLVAPLAWLGWLGPVLLGAAIGATAIMLLTARRLNGKLSSEKLAEAKVERSVPLVSTRIFRSDGGFGGAGTAPPILLARVATACATRPRTAAGCALILAVLGLLTIRADLGVSTDTGTLFSASLPWKQRQNALRDAFPQTKNILVAVIDAAIPEEADATADALAAALRHDSVHFTAIREPTDSPFLQRNGLLYASADKLGALLDQTVDAQPFLGRLAADPSLNGLAGALSLIAQGVVRQHADLSAFAPALRGFHSVLAAPVATPLSWQNLLAGPVASLAGRYRFVLIKPKLDYGALQPGAPATRAVRAAAATLEFVRAGSARVRITGPVALDDDEFATVAQGAAGGLAASLMLVTLWLWIAVRSWRLILPILATLLLGLDLTAAFAALAVGTLNLVSVAFAVLFVGLAVDFAIQFAVRFREASTTYPDTAAALGAAGQRSGGQILVASLSTAAGFLAFTPTSFAGVAQLGLIAGIGMLIAFACTLTALPAFVALCRPAPEAGEVGFVWARAADAAILRHRWPVLAAAALLALLGLALLPWLQFDGDPLHTKNQSSESVTTLNDLAADPITNPYSIEMLEPSIDKVAAVSARLRALPTVGGTVSLDSLVPDGQAEKLPMITDAASILLPTLVVQPAPPPDAAALHGGVARALPALREAAADLPLNDPFTVLTHDLEQLQTAPDARVLAASRALTRFLPSQLNSLRTALGAGPVTRADIPAALAADWILPDGRAKLQVLPTRAAARNSAGLHRFVAEVIGVAPEASGAAVAIVRSADTIVAAFRFAAIGALAAITIILLIALRRLRDAALVLAPLLLSSLLTVIAAVALPLPLNFANIIALPLLLGVGVSFNVYFVMNWRAGAQMPLGSATARAVLFSALTTATAFGSLALSKHPGTASMGALLLVSLACTLLSTLTFLPALLGSVARETAPPGQSH